MTRDEKAVEIAKKYADPNGVIPASAIRKIQEEVRALPATYMVVAHPPVYLPGTEYIASLTDRDEAEQLARDLSAKPRHLKAWVYQDGVRIAEYGMGYKYDRFTS